MAHLAVEGVHHLRPVEGDRRDLVGRRLVPDGTEVGSAAHRPVHFGSRLSMKAAGPSFARSEEHTSELQSLMRISYAVFCLKKKKILHSQTPTSSSTVHIREIHLYT